MRAQIQRMLNLTREGETFRLPTDNYSVDGTLVIPKGVTFDGNGSVLSGATLSGSVDSRSFSFRIKNMQIRDSELAIDLTKASSILINNVQCHACGLAAIFKDESYYNHLSFVDAHSCDVGFKFIDCSESHLYGCRTNVCPEAVSISGSSQITLQTCSFELFDMGIDIKNQSGPISIQNTRFESGMTGINIGAGCLGVVLESPYFSSIDTEYVDDSNTLVMKSRDGIRLEGGQLRALRMVAYQLDTTLPVGTTDILINLSGAQATDSVFVTPDNTLPVGVIVAGGNGYSDTVYIRVANLTELPIAVNSNLKITVMRT